MPDNWIVDLEEELKTESSVPRGRIAWWARCICQVPQCMKDLHKKVYTPTMASFGPYHYGDVRFKAMEPHKRRLLDRYLCSANKTLEEVADEFREEVDYLMEHYDGLDEKWEEDKEKFLELMILDGCFLLEILLSVHQFRSRDVFDPILSKPYIKFRLLKDMMLLENQLPFRVLEILVQLGGENIGTSDALSLVLAVHCPDVLPCAIRELPRDIQHHLKEQLSTEELPKHIKDLPPNIELHLKKQLLPQRESGRVFRHCLDVYRTCMIARGGYFYNVEVDVKNASELVQSGIHLGTSETNCFKDISFGTTGGLLCKIPFLNYRVLRLPRISVDDRTESLLLNASAFEQLHGLIGNHVVFYLLFMDRLIDTSTDVALLKKKGIIMAGLGADEEIADVFNNLSKEVHLIRGLSAKADVNKELDKYCRKWWPWMQYSFKQAYLRNPWVFISLVGALLLLGLTILQTVYTIKSYYNTTTSS